MVTPKKTMVLREEVFAKVEELMVKGIQSPSIIAQEVKCSIPMALKYIETIHKRWELSKNTDFAKMKTVLMEKSFMQERMAWEAFNDADNSSAKVGCLNVISEIHKFQAWLAGINAVLGDKK